MKNRIDVKDLSDIIAIEKISMEERGVTESTCEAIKKGAVIDPERRQYGKNYQD